MKYQCIKQQSEEDCGAACLASIAKHYGRTLTINRIRQVVGTRQRGTTMLGMKKGADTLGFNARAIKADHKILDNLHQVPLPAVIHWKGCHYVVLYGKEGNQYIIADPAMGIRHLNRGELKQGWSDGVILLLEPDPTRFAIQPDDQDKTSGFGRFLRRVLPYRFLIANTLVLNLVLGLLSITSPFLIQILTDEVLVDGNKPLLNQIAIAVVVMTVVRSFLELAQSNLIAHFAQRLQLGLALNFCRQILGLPLAYYESRRSGEVVSRLDDIQEINQLVSQVVISLPSKIFIALVSIIFMLFHSPKLTLAAAGIAVLMFLSTFLLWPSLQRKTRQVMELDAENQGVLVETFKGAITLKTTLATPQLWDEFQSRFGRLANLTFRTMQIGITNNFFSGLVSGIGSIGLLWFGSTLVINQELSIGQLMAFNSMNGNFTSLISTLVGFADEYISATTAIDRLAQIIDAEPEAKDSTSKPWVKIASDANIICDNLNFYHDHRVNLLHDFSLTFPGGQVIALIGKSGCGKSTLAKLIAALYSAQSGNIRFGIYNQEDLSLDCLRQQIMLVPQDAHFWSRSIIENFYLGSPDVTFDRIITACQITGADEFIDKLPATYQTVLGEFGANLSGGQRQRLAIARAIINDPPVLILDESTGALDPVSETEVLEKLLKHRCGKTTIMISHRPRVIQLADWIVLLEKGRLKIQGSLQDLRSQPGNHLDFLIEDFNQAAQIKAEAYHNRGIGFLANRDYQRAIEDFSQALKINPHYASAYGNRSNSRYKLGDVEGAIEDLWQAATLFSQEGNMANYQRAVEAIESLNGGN